MKMRNSQRTSKTIWRGAIIGWALLFFIATPQAASAQWTTAGNDVYKTNTAGNVGIGTTGPQKSLHVVTDLDSSSAKAVWIAKDDNLSGLRIGYRQTNNYSELQAFVSGQPDKLILNPSGGNVGIGTSTPGAPLEIRTDQNASTNLYINNATSGSGTGAATTLQFFEGTTLNAQIRAVNSGASGYTGGANAMQIWNFRNAPTLFATNSTERMRIDSGGNVGIGTTTPSAKLDVNGNINVSGNINAKYQDVAEWVPSSEQLAAGTVVVLDATRSNQVISSTVSYDTRVAGVISAQPGIALGEKSDNKVLVATTGRVRVKVDASKGAIRIGDLLVTSDTPGVAMKSEPNDIGGRKMHMPGTLIGKALEPLAKGLGEILVLLSLQ